MATLIMPLALSGSRLSDGSPNSSGKVFLYVPGTTTIIPGFVNDELTEAWTTDGGGIPLDEGGRVSIWINVPVDVVVTDADGTTVDTFLGFNKTSAELVEVENEHYTGTLTDSATGEVSQGLGGKTDLDTLLTLAAESLGDDFEYQESEGATSRPYIEVIRGIAVSVKDFGARGDNIADDTTAIQRALSEMLRLGSGTLIFDPGTYRTTGAVTLLSATNVHIIGNGAVISSENTGANVLALTTCTQCSITGLEATYSSGSTTGSCVAVSGGFGNLLDRVFTSNGLIGVSTSCNSISVRDCDNANSNGASGRGVVVSAGRAIITGGRFIAGSGAAIEFTGTANKSRVFGVDFGSGAPSSPVGVLFSATLAGTGFGIANCPSLGTQTTPIDITAATIDPFITQRGNNAESIGTSGATGGTQTPRFIGHNQILLVASSGGAGTVVVATPAVLPSASNLGRYWDMVFVNAAGGAVTWDITTSTKYKFAAAVPTTAAHTISVRVYWDGTSFREASRADTVT